MNKVCLVGNVGQDPKVRGEEKKVASFTLATKETYKDSSGQRQTITDWHNCIAFGGLSKVVEDYVKKGMLLSVVGKIRTRSYDAAGGKRYITEIVVGELNMLSGGKPKSTESEPAEDDDLPF